MNTATFRRVKTMSPRHLSELSVPAPSPTQALGSDADLYEVLRRSPLEQRCHVQSVVQRIALCCQRPSTTSSSGGTPTQWPMPLFAVPSRTSIVNWRQKRHNGAMPSVQIKDVPEDTHAVLRQRAAAAHQSLQEYLRTRLIEEAAQPTLDEVLERAGGRAGGSVPLTAAVAAVRDDRARR